MRWGRAGALTCGSCRPAVDQPVPERTRRRELEQRGRAGARGHQRSLAHRQVFRRPGRFDRILRSAPGRHGPGSDLAIALNGKPVEDIDHVHLAKKSGQPGRTSSPWWTSRSKANCVKPWPRAPEPIRTKRSARGSQGRSAHGPRVVQHRQESRAVRQPGRAVRQQFEYMKPR